MTVTGQRGTPRSSPTSSSRARFADRARSARWRSSRPVLGGIAVGVVIAALAAFVYAGPVLVLREVVVSGVQGSLGTQVRAAAAAPMNEPLAQVDTAAIVARVRALPFVAGVSVHRQWPSTLGVAVRARTPAALVPDPPSGYRIVDGSGIAYGTSARPLSGVPVITVDLTPASRPALLAALTVLAALPPGIRSTVRSVTARSPDDVRLRVGKTTVVWGGPDRSERKARIYEELRRTRASVYDLSSPDTPVLR